MIETFRGVPVEELAAALGGTVLGRVRVPEPAAVVRGVVMHAPGDPPPDADLLVLCTTPEAELPACVAVVLRETQAADATPRLPASTAVFTAPDSARWSDVYDTVQWAMQESFGQLAAHDAFQLADALATALGGAVAIEDARRRVVAFSTVPGQRIDDVRRQGILNLQVPEHVEREKWYSELWRNAGVTEFSDGTESTDRLAIPVRAGAEPLGSIWVVGSHATLNPNAAEILERSVGVIAACLTHQDNFAFRGREARRQILCQLLGTVTGAAAVVGFSVPGPTVLVALAGNTDRIAGDRLDAELLHVRLADVMSLHAHRFQGLRLAAAIDDRVYALLPASDRPRLDASLRGQLSRTALTAGWIAVSGVIDRTDQLSGARRQVDRLLALSARRAGRPQIDIVHVDDEADNLLLAEIADAVRGLEPLRGGVVSRITEYDREHGTAYVSTLRAWFESYGDVAAAAVRLHVHANTFRYRMARAGALFGLRLDQPDERLLLHLQLRLAEF